MWSLKSLKDESCCYNLLVGVDYIVGRRNAQILLLDDLSISRQHSFLTVVHPEENLVDPEKLPVLKLKDASSKYGTFKNDERLDKDQEVLLSENDVVKFGQFESKFRVCYSPLVVTTSCIQPALKNDLKKVIRKLGGHIIPEWQLCCTHLIMSDIKVTVKALCCLVSLKPIITPQYLADVLKGYAKQLPIPDAKSYLPPIGEPLLEKDKAVFSVLPERKTLFKDKTFIFLEEKQMKKLHLALTMAGANAVLFNESCNIDDLLTKPGSCVIQPFGEKLQNEKFTSFVKSVTSILRRKKKRIIPESDFGLAVAYCSTEKFCNPNFDIGGTLLEIPKVSSQTFTEDEVYVPNTDEQESRKRVLMEKMSSMEEIISSRKRKVLVDGIVNPSIEENESNSNDKSRPYYSEGAAYSSNKRLKTEVTSSAVDAVIDISGEEREGIKSSRFNLLDANVEQIQAAIVVDDDDDDGDDDDIQIIETVEISDLSALPGRKMKSKTRNESSHFPADDDESTKVQRQLPDVLFSTNDASIVLPNGFRSTSKANGTVSATDLDEELPRNLVKVNVVALVKHRVPLAPVPSENCDNGVINFKKFKKVLHVGARALPTIIGGSDLVSHSKSGAMDDWLQENAEVESPMDVEDSGEFDWQSQKVRSRAR